MAHLCHLTVVVLLLSAGDPDLWWRSMKVAVDVIKLGLCTAHMRKCIFCRWGLGFLMQTCFSLTPAVLRTVAKEHGDAHPGLLAATTYMSSVVLVICPWGL